MNIKISLIIRLMMFMIRFSLGIRDRKLIVIFVSIMKISFCVNFIGDSLLFVLNRMCVILFGLIMMVLKFMIFFLCGR